MNARPTGWDGRSARWRGRLARARALLRSRLTRRGITASAAIAAIDTMNGPARAAVPAALREATVLAAAQAVSGRTVATIATARVASWVAHASRGLAFSFWKTAVSVPISLATVATGLGLATLGASPSPTQTPEDARTSLPELREEILREMLKLKGTWSSMQTLESTVNGVPQKSRQFKMLWSIDRDTIKDTGEDGFAARTFRYILDLKKEPKNIDLTLLNSGLTLYGIYKLEENSLTVCWAPANVPRISRHDRVNTACSRSSSGRAAIRLNCRRSARTPRAAIGPSNPEVRFQGRSTPTESI